MEHARYSESPVYNLRNQAGLEVRPLDDRLQAVPQDPAGLEVRPGRGLILSQDDEKMVTSEFSQPKHQPRKYCGMSAKTSVIVLVVLVLVVVAVAVGAGIGASKHSASSTTSPPPTSISTTTLLPPTSTTTTDSASATPDPGVCKNGTTYTSSNNTPFEQVCDTDFMVGKAHNTSATDWNSITNVATFQGCMDACALDRSQGIVVADVVGTCLSITWASKPGDCYMKNATALIGSSNKTAQMMHAVPRAQAGLQSANIVGQ